jgi:Domain of unknown function (DUF4214)/Glycosyl hydrolase catalytic core
MLPRLLITAACLLATMVPARADDLIWGANGHPVTSYPGTTIEQQLDYLQDLGMRSYRVDIPDASKAPMLAELVRAAKARGIQILPVLTPSGINLKTDSPKAIYRIAYDLAFKLGSAFKDDIRVWELGNELENFAIIKACEQRDDGTKYPCEWGPAGGLSPLDYYGPRWAKVSAELKGLSDGMIAVDPTIRKAMGTAGWGHTGAFERMQRDGIRWDISVWHIYSKDFEWAFKKLARYKRPIWVTEFNNPYGSQHGEQQQAEGLQKIMSQLRAFKDTYKVEAAHVYELMDESYWKPSLEAYQGLVRLVADRNGNWRAGEPKPAYAVARDIIRRPMPRAVPNRDCEMPKWSVATVSASLKVAYGYCLILGRAADKAGLDSWVETIRTQHTSQTDVLLAMLKSREFTRRYSVYGLTDQDYISFLFRLLINREPDGAGLESYAKELKSGAMTRASVAAGILLSSEFKKLHPILFAPVQAANPPTVRASR